MLGIFGKKGSNAPLVEKQEPYLQVRAQPSRAVQPKSAATRRYEALLETGMMAFLVVDSGGKIAEWSSAAAEMFLYTDAEIKGENYSILFSPESRAQAEPTMMLRAAYENGLLENESSLYRKDGSKVDAVYQFIVVRKDERVTNGCIVLFLPSQTNVIKPSSELTLIAHESSNIATRYEPTDKDQSNTSYEPYQAFADCVVLMDLDCSTIWVNRNGLNLIEVSNLHEVVGSNWLRSWQGEALHGATNAIGNAKVGSNGRFQGLSLTRSGAPRWWDVVVSPILDGEGMPHALMAVGRDITDYKLNEERTNNNSIHLTEVAASRTKEYEDMLARQNTILNNTRQLIGVIDLDGRVLEANKIALDLIDASINDVQGKFLWETSWFSKVPDMAELVRTGVAQAREGMGVQREIIMKLPDGSERVYDFLLNPVRDRDGHVIEIVPEATDITEKRMIAEQLQQSQKMEAVGHLTGGLAHDFNNLLAGISGSLQMLGKQVEQGRTGDDLKKYIDAALVETNRASALTHRLLAFSRRQTLDPKLVKINQLIMGMEDMLRRSMGPGVQMEFLLSDDIWPVLADASQLENGLLNLCINARDAMPDGGHLLIGTKNDQLAFPQARSLGIKPGEYIILSVLDTGSGMSPDIAARAFDPFYTTKPLGMGTGLGLSMVYGFAQQSGGTATIQSSPGQGTEITLYLPRHIAVATESEESTDFGGYARTGVKSGGDILVVDDEQTVRDLVVEVVSEIGCKALQAWDGPSALKTLREDGNIDLLITDVGLPNGMNGRQLADAARELRAGIPVLFITGYAESALTQEGTLASGMHLLVKPFSLDDLQKKVKEILS